MTGEPGNNWDFPIENRDRPNLEHVVGKPVGAGSFAEAGKPEARERKHKDREKIIEHRNRGPSWSSQPGGRRMRGSSVVKGTCKHVGPVAVDGARGGYRAQCLICGYVEPVRETSEAARQAALPPERPLDSGER